MSAAAVDRLLAEVAREVNALPPIARRKMAPVLAQARRETASAFSHWLKNAKDAEERFTAQQYRNVIAQLDQALSTIAELEPATFDGLVLADRAAGPLALSHVERELAAFAKEFGGSVIPLPLQHAIATLEGKETLMKRFASSAARYAGQVGDDIRREISIGMIRGESLRDVAARLVRHGGPRGKVALEGMKSAPGAVSEIITDGLFKRYDSWADRLARTEVLNAYNVRADETIAVAHEVDHRIERMWSGVEDRRECVICRSLDGKTTAVGEPFPYGYDNPPAHPYCRCTVIAWRSDWGKP